MVGHTTLRVATMSALLVTPAFAQTFAFSASDIIAKYNAEQKKEEADTLTSCKKVGDDTICRYTSDAFNKAVVALKSLNLVNGNFTDRGKVIFTEEKEKVSLIILLGDRSDPANISQTIGIISGMLTVLGMTDQGYKTLLPELGLRRGDDNPSIGQPTVTIENYALITCNNQRSDVSTTFGCVLAPRF